jgi:hypothetical protein
MAKNYFIIAFVAVVSAFIFNNAFTYDNGIAGRTNSPGESNCTGCHNSYGLNTGGGSVSISCPTMTNWEYVAGQTYQINLTITKSGVSNWGFGFEALRSTGANGGTLTVTNTTQTTIKSATVSGNLRTNLVHKVVNTGASPKTISFNWTAPTTNQGNITFYAAANAANGTGNTAGDYIYTTSQVVTPNTTAIQEVSNENIDFTVFPNPAKQFLNISFSNKQNADLKIETYTIDGRFMDLLAMESISSGSHSYHFDLKQSYPAGLYLIKLTLGNGVAYKRVMIVQ